MGCHGACFSLATRSSCGFVHFQLGLVGPSRLCCTGWTYERVCTCMVEKGGAKLINIRIIATVISCTAVYCPSMTKLMSTWLQNRCCCCHLLCWICWSTEKEVTNLEFAFLKSKMFPKYIASDTIRRAQQTGMHHLTPVPRKYTRGDRAHM